MEIIITHHVALRIRQRSGDPTTIREVGAANSVAPRWHRDRLAVSLVSPRLPVDPVAKYLDDGVAVVVTVVPQHVPLKPGTMVLCV